MEWNIENTCKLIELYRENVELWDTTQNLFFRVFFLLLAFFVFSLKMSESGILKPGEKIKPTTTLREVENLIKFLYGLENFTMVELNGYDDKNYKISVKSDNAQTDYTFKIMNSLDSKNTALVEGQNAIMFFLSSKGVICPKPISNKNGKHFSVQTFSSGEHAVRLLTYIPGTILYSTKPTSKIYYEIGREVANLDFLLKDFHHPALNTRKTIWMMDSIPTLRQYLFAVKDDYKRNLFEKIILEFEERVLKIKDDLDKGIIHGDINEQNILTKQIDNELCFGGLLDFGDVSYSCYLFELAIAVTYIMIVEIKLEPAGYVLAGYSKIRTIPDNEMSLLKLCTMARICQSNILGIYASLQEPDNPYVLVSVDAGWKLLQKLINETEEETLHNWMTIAGNCSY